MDFQEYIKSNMNVDCSIDIGSTNDPTGVPFTCCRCRNNDWMLVRKGIQVDTLECKSCRNRQFKLKWG